MRITCNLFTKREIGFFIIIIGNKIKMKINKIHDLFSTVLFHLIDFIAMKDQ